MCPRVCCQALSMAYSEYWPYLQVLACTSREQLSDLRSVALEPEVSIQHVHLPRKCSGHEQGDTGDSMLCALHLTHMAMEEAETCVGRKEDHCFLTNMSLQVRYAGNGNMLHAHLYIAACDISSAISLPLLTSPKIPSNHPPTHLCPSTKFMPLISSHGTCFHVLNGDVAQYFLFAAFTANLPATSLM